MEFQQFFLVAVSTLGFISLCKSFINFLTWVWLLFLRPLKNLKEYGSWALITGPTDGIEKSLAFEMASKDLNLEATANEIHVKYGKKIHNKDIAIDLAKFSGLEIANAIEEGIKGIDVGILEVDLELMESIVKVNMEGATWITRAVLPVMLRKKKGAIVNIGSASSETLLSYPIYTIYAASKAGKGDTPQPRYLHI
ncbi:hypothetical protein DVH24_040964 [Malus domestica]|uniref:Uncharacterized protein n=1 Tax=Malus domestica TaxID=3750 RepID=A0A498ICT6_MALDO|nr:hypothetical protein DVH24_040964 [Malus domestica]